VKSLKAFKDKVVVEYEKGIVCWVNKEQQ
jgi:hypothetical protein